MTTISIICPAYNEEKHIAHTLNSFLGQKLEGFDMEVLIVDGMSEDKTRDIVHSFEQNHHNIRLIDNVRRKTPLHLTSGFRKQKVNTLPYWEPIHHMILTTCWFVLRS